MKSRVLIWGSGGYYKNKQRVIENTYDIIGYISSDKQKKDTISPDEICQYSYDYILLMSTTYLFEMVKDAKKLDIDLNKLILGPNLPPLTNSERQYISDRKQLFLDLKGDIYYRNDDVIIQIRTLEDIQKAIQLNISSFDKELFDELPLKPVSYLQGCEWGDSIARKYINQFIEENQHYIRGTVVEIGDRRYSNKYKEKITESYVFDLYNESDMYNIKGNLETGDGVQESLADCFIITQTLEDIFDLHTAAKNIIKMLKTNGTVLLTASGISPIIRYDYETYGLYWRFTDQCLKRLFADFVGEDNIDIRTYGNAKTSSAFLYGVPSAAVEREDISYQDRDFQLIIGAVIKKN